MSPDRRDQLLPKDSDDAIYELGDRSSQNTYRFSDDLDIQNNLNYDEGPSFIDSEFGANSIDQTQRQLPLFDHDGYQSSDEGHKKKKAPYYIFFIVVFVIILGSVVYFNSSNPSKQADLKKESAELKANNNTQVLGPSEQFSSTPNLDQGMPDNLNCPSNKTYLSFKDYHRGYYVAGKGTIEFIKHPSNHSVDGLYLTSDSDVKVSSFLGDFQQVLATHESIAKAFKDSGFENVPTFYSVTPSFDWEYLLIQTKYEQVWRHSSVSTYYVYDVNKKSVKPLSTVNNSMIMLAVWAPVGHRISFVIENDLYISDINAQVRVTDDGGENIFNGISDWVYEEEVLSSPNSHWWSPDGSKLIFIKFNDTLVPEMKYSVFHSEKDNKSYPELAKIKYPKPGFPNPSASIYIYNANFGKSVPQVLDFTENEWLITQVAWITQDSSQAIVKISNRIQNHFKVYLATINANSGYSYKLVREINTNDTDKAWVDITESLIYVPKGTIQNNQDDGYIDIVENDGYVHLGFFSPPDSSVPSMLTQGNWDVIDSSPRLDIESKKLYFLSTIRSSYSSEVYILDFASKSTQPLALTPAKQAPQGYDSVGSYKFEISNRGKYISLNYIGPSVPWSAVYSLDSSAKLGTLTYVTQENSDLRDRLSSINLPTVRYYNVTIPDVSQPLDCSIIFPPCYDPSKKSHYSVLFNVYAGPNSKHVSESYKFNDWNSIAVSANLNQEEYGNAPPLVVINIDPRGTAHKGRSFSRIVSKQLGVAEAKDIIASAEYLLKEHPSFDPSKVAIWGWSYGGFMALKVLELSKTTFKAGASVAPVTDWMFYDSIYTERYMDTPQNNSDGYKISAISDYASIAKKKLLLMHGTADDNVHIQNSYVLLDKLQSISANNVSVMFYPDSDHSIYHNNARSYLNNRLAGFLFSVL